MKTCAYCGSTIILGGAKEGDLRFCNESCHTNGIAQIGVNEISDEEVLPLALSIFHGKCPICHKHNGNVEMHKIYKIYSFILLTQWKTKPFLSCIGCGKIEQAKALVSNLLFGWWGVPWGILGTPVVIVKNVKVLISSPIHNTEPSQDMIDFVKGLVVVKTLR